MIAKIRALCAAAMIFAVPTAALAQNAQVPPAEVCFSGPTKGINGMIGVLGAITPGSGGASGTYTNVPLTGGSGTGGTANITVAGGVVTQVAVLNPGLNYVVSDTLSAASANIGGVTGFSVPVNSISINSSLAGGTVGMFIPGTLTVKQTYQNASGTILNSNPIKLDSNGCAIIYGSGTYRQILSDSLGNVVWDQPTSVAPVNPYFAGNAGGTANAITVNDGSFSGADGQIIQFIAAITNTGPTTITPSGTGSPISVVKNTSTGPLALTGGEIVAGNLVTVTYSASLGEFFLSATPFVQTQPLDFQGRLTLVQGSPVVKTTVTNRSVIFYAPYKGNLVSIYNGSTVGAYQFTSGSADMAGQSITLGSSYPANSIFDVFDTLVNGAPVLCTVAWSSTTSRVITTLQRFNGFLTNSSTAACRTTNAATVNMVANQGTYLGSFYTNSTAGEVDFNFGGTSSGGTAASLGLWNYYNRVAMNPLVTDNGSAYSYSGSLRQARASAGNQISFMIGVSEDSFPVNYTFNVETTSSGSVGCGVGFNSVLAVGITPAAVNNLGPGANFVGATNAGYWVAPTGIDVLSALESGSGTFDEASVNQLSAAPPM